MHNDPLDRFALAHLCLIKTNVQVILPRTMPRARNPRSLVVRVGQHLPIHLARLETVEVMTLIFFDVCSACQFLAIFLF